MTTDRVSCTISDGVADVRLNRPDKLNALDLAMFRAIAEVGDRLRADPDVRAVVISGEGRGFCAGLDLSMLAASLPTSGSGDGKETGLFAGRGGDRIDNNAQRAAWLWHEMDVPVIAALHGVVFGGGIQIALGADLRIAAPDSRLSVMEVRWGLVPDMTGTYTLTRAVGLDVAKELTWTGRIVDGAEALRLGLVTRLSDDPRGDALTLAGDLAARNPDALRLAKQLLNDSLGAEPAAQLLAEEAAASRLIGTPNQEEAVAAGLGNRPARFLSHSK